jgi:hydroxymethylpyrimidine pyrophosphatase-like HAD family hydrolase
VPLEEALVEDPIQVMFNGAVDTMRALAEELRNAARSARQGGPTFQETGRNAAPRAFSVSLTEYAHRDFSLIDITAPEATKGRALAWRAAQLALTRDEVMAVGDNFNDLEMLQFAGTPVVMANAVDGLKTYGWHVTGGQNEAGLAEAIRRFAL